MALEKRGAAALAALPERLRQLPRMEVASGFNIVGIEALQNLFNATSVSRPKPVSSDEHSAAALPPLSSLIDEVAATGHGLVMVMGKGGVGKTTIAAAIATELAARGLPVHLTTTDPAAHLSFALGESATT
ncbi:MAG: ArsA-related P-loop ATPase [Acidobacteriota bacterium]